ncbi:MAG: prepilin-type N-terminal cleavage/methylation domain-containing protein [Bacilli bacterium]|nr:prepilin-type N-terminal cleavage/methylation domain-containing protein [Bacilli bacterium]
MNRKAFTLIELLGVIVILSLVIILVYGEFSRQVKTAKQKAYDRQVETIISSAKDYHLQYTNETGVLLNTLGDYDFINPDDLIDPRDNSLMTGCVVFSVNGYGSYDYSYESDMLDCDGTYLIKGYVYNDLYMHLDAKNNGGYGIKDDNSVWSDITDYSNNVNIVNIGTTENSGWQSDSLALDGIDDGIYVGDVLKNLMKFNNTIEIVVSFKSNSLANLFSNYNANNNISLIKNTSNNLGVNWNNNSVNNANATILSLYTKYTLSFVLNKAVGEINLYINGVLDDTFSSLSFMTDQFDWDNLYIGRDMVDANNALFGNIYSVRVYGDVLSSDEILRNYQIDHVLYGV